MKNTKKNLFDSLRLHDVYLAQSTSELHDGFDPKYVFNLEDLDLQTFTFIDHHEIAGIKKHESDDEIRLLRTTFSFGARWLCQPIGEQPSLTTNETSETDDPRIVQATIEARFISEYIITQEVDKDKLDEFAETIAAVEVYPYWREFLSSQINRMHLTGVTMPKRKKTPR